MTFTTLTGLLNTLSSLGLAAFVFFKRPKHTTNQAYLFFGLTVGLYSVGYFLWGLAPSAAEGLFAFKILTSGIILINSAYLEFVFSLLGERKRKWILWTCHVVNLYFVYATLSLQLFKSVVQKNIWGYWPVVENLFYAYFAIWLGQFLYGLLNLYVGYKKTHGQRSTQIKYVFASTLIGYFGGATNWLPWFNITFFPPHLNILVTAYVAILAYAVVRHHLMDVEVVIKRTLVFTGLFATALVIVAVITTVAQSYIGQSARFTPIVSTALSVFIAILLYDPVRSFLEKLTENVLFQKKVDYEKIEEDVSNSIKITDLDKLCQSLVGIFYEGMKLTHVILFLYDEEKKEFRIGASRGIGREPWLALKESDSLTQGLRRENTGTVYLKADLEIHQKVLSKGLEALRCETLAKVVFEDRLIALLCLGKKKSDEDFTTRDQQLLLKAANQMAVSISHATTFRLQRDYYALQAQRNKSDALSNLSAGLGHEVKNPLNQIRPRVELLIDAYENKRLRSDDPAILDNLQTQLRHVDRIIKIMDRLSRFARPTEGEAIKLGAVSLRPFVEEAIGLIGEKQLANDNIKVEIKIPDDLPTVYAEETSLIQVFYNLIVNAHHAINRNGVIRIGAQDVPQDGKVLVKIEDTGKGIPPENIEKIFEPFFTTKPTNLPQDGSERFTGSGLGLAFVKKYMEDLGGSVTVTSQVGKGTTFYLKFLRSRGEKE